MNDKEHLKQMVRAIIEDYSEFIARKANAFAQELKKHPSDIPHSVKMEKMVEWVDEFVEIASEQFKEIN